MHRVPNWAIRFGTRGGAGCLHGVPGGCCDSGTGANGHHRLHGNYAPTSPVHWFASLSDCDLGMAVYSAIRVSKASSRTKRVNAPCVSSASTRVASDLKPVTNVLPSLLPIKLVLRPQSRIMNTILRCSHSNVLVACCHLCRRVLYGQLVCLYRRLRTAGGRRCRPSMCKSQSRSS